MGAVKTICAWCKKDLTPEITEYQENQVSHTMCGECLEKHAYSDRETLSDYLDGVSYPVLIIDDKGLVLSGNKTAKRSVARALPDLGTTMIGDAMECANALDLKGCGHTQKCEFCSLRDAFEHTYRTGKTVRDKKVALEKPPDGSKHRFLLSTEKRGRVVLVKVEPRD